MHTFLTLPIYIHTLKIISWSKFTWNRASFARHVKYFKVFKPSADFIQLLFVQHLAYVALKSVPHLNILLRITESTSSIYCNILHLYLCLPTALSISHAICIFVAHFHGRRIIFPHLSGSTNWEAPKWPHVTLYVTFCKINPHATILPFSVHHLHGFWSYVQTRHTWFVQYQKMVPPHWVLFLPHEWSSGVV